MKKINDLLAAVPMTIIAGISLLISILSKIKGIGIGFDPAWLAIIICGIPLLYLGIGRMIYNKGVRKISSALLITIAMLAAIFIGDVFAAGEVAFIMSIGAILEEKTTQRAQKGLKKLIGLAPVQGRKVLEGKEVLIKAQEIKEGDTLRVFPGEIIPVDGRVIIGNTSIDQSIMTGESLPVDKVAGDLVFCGTLNTQGSIDLQATKVGQDSSLQKMIQMVKEAEEKKAPMARIADLAASWLVPVALLIAIVTYLFTGDIVRGVTILVVFCPCALVLATPTAIMAAIGQASKHGVIIKSGEALENMGKSNIITFDKTGTLTKGKLDLQDIQSFSSQYGKEEILSLIASAESRSEHPLGKAIVAYAKDQGIEIIDPEEFRMEAGKGIRARIGSKEILCGNEKFLLSKKIEISKQVEERLKKFRQEGKASILASINGVCLGIVSLSDVIREDAKSMVEDLMAMGTKVVLLTGDNRLTADYFAHQLGIQRVQADLLPGQKVEKIQDLGSQGEKVCMIGDGVNDAPALKIADVGVAMGSMGSDIAIEAADLALMTDDLSKIPYLKRLANATVGTIKFSIGLSLIINAIAIGLSIMGKLTPTTGALVHNAGSVLVVLIAALLYDRKFD